MTSASRTGWIEGFSKLLPNWKIRNNSPPFSAAEYRKADQVNRRHNRTAMERVFRRIEESCGEPKK